MAASINSRIVVCWAVVVPALMCACPDSSPPSVNAADLAGAGDEGDVAWPDLDEQFGDGPVRDALEADPWIDPAPDSEVPAADGEDPGHDPANGDTRAEVGECLTDADCGNQDACSSDRCIDGRCHRNPADCDDGDPCTQDFCASQAGCMHAPVADPTCSCCASDEACGSPDLCRRVRCVDCGCRIEDASCDDANPCTIDNCLQKAGCVHDRAPSCVVECTKDSDCTPSWDQCGVPRCELGASPPACTVVPVQDGLWCDDGSACTTGDTCLAGHCGGTMVPCVDDDPCTQNLCDLSNGCVFVPVAACAPACATDVDCADGNQCLTHRCVEGKCLYRPVACGTAPTCMTVRCEPRAGCVYTAKPDCQRCAGDLDCLWGDPCKQGRCDTATGWCQVLPVSCHDENTCTEDSCIKDQGCAHAPRNCDDGNACTVDSCVPGLGCAHAPADCEDSDACTTGSCDLAAGCVHAARSCDDGNECTASVPVILASPEPSLRRARSGQKGQNRWIQKGLTLDSLGGIRLP